MYFDYVHLHSYLSNLAKNLDLFAKSRNFDLILPVYRSPCHRKGISRKLEQQHETAASLFSSWGFEDRSTLSHSLQTMVKTKPKSFPGFSSRIDNPFRDLKLFSGKYFC